MANAFSQALRLLSRREHGARELTEKLIQKGYTQDEAEQALVTCQQQGLQSERRFIEALVRSRMRQGYGPQRIKQELQAKQVDTDLLDEILHDAANDWLDCARQVWHKKARGIPLNFEQVQKLKRFLLYRGFPSAIIQQVVSEVD